MQQNRFQAWLSILVFPPQIFLKAIEDSLPDSFPELPSFPVRVPFPSPEVLNLAMLHRGRDTHTAAAPKPEDRKVRYFLERLYIATRRWQKQRAFLRSLILSQLFPAI